MTLGLAEAIPEANATTKGVCALCGVEFEIVVRGQKYCSPQCRVKSNSRKYYAANKERIIAYHRGWQKNNPGTRKVNNAKYRAVNRTALAQKQRARHLAVREWIHGIKASLKCSKCGESRPICLDFHHTNGSDKEYAIAVMTHKNYSKEKFLKEMAKCIVLCRNCHAVEHWERRTEENS